MLLLAPFGRSAAISGYGQERLFVLATSQYFLLLACRQVGLGKDFQKRFGTSFLSIACRQVETGKCGISSCFVIALLLVSQN